MSELEKTMGLMPLQQLLFASVIFFAVSGLTYGLFLVFRRRDLEQRLDTVVGIAGSADPSEGRPQWIESFVKLAAPLAKLSVPDEGWEASGLRRRFMHAGLRDPSTPTLFFALKTALAVAAPLMFWVTRAITAAEFGSEEFLFYLVCASAAGFYLPNLMLNRRVKQRQLEIFEGFPDALDLLTVCVEAGLSLEGSLNRVAREIRLRSPVLADELELVSLEWRAGGGKERALRNLALRTGVEDLETLVAMLVQSEKFGTSIGESLRVHSSMLRTKRQQRAEEAAAKVAVKLVFPLVLFIFPSILIVVAGPAMIQIGKTMSTVFGD